MSDRLVVRSHVARDLLQTSALFKTDKAVVWEYVSNGLDYSEEATPTVYVEIEPTEKRIRISDNGRGMDWAGLQNFFTMHGENIDRRQGRANRGMFGTGKSAAFGIGEVLRITTVRKGRRSIVELAKSEIKAMRSEAPVPIRVIEREQSATEPSGTSVEIEGIRLRKLDIAGVMAHIQQQLAQMPRHVRVFVNHRECEYHEPVAVDVRKITAEDPYRSILGDVVLTVKVAGTPLEEHARGIAVYSGGVLHDRTLAGLESKDMAQYIFGSIEVPALDAEAESPIPAFDMSRSMKLNVENELVRSLYAFIGQTVDRIRRELVDAERARRANENSKRLASEAAMIAKVINDDFSDFRNKITRIAARGRGTVDSQHLRAAESPQEEAVPGGALAAVEEDFQAAGADGTNGSGGSEPRLLKKALRLDAHGSLPASPASSSSDGRRAAGGFGVRFHNMGTDEMRAKYVRDERLIYINLDHPQLVAARPLEGVEDQIFRQLCYEIAFSEYSIALASELAREGEYIELSDPIVDIRNTINRLARRAAVLFARSVH